MRKKIIRILSLFLVLLFTSPLLLACNQGKDPADSGTEPPASQPGTAQDTPGQTAEQTEPEEEETDPYMAKHTKLLKVTDTVISEERAYVFNCADKDAVKGTGLEKSYSVTDGDHEYSGKWANVHTNTSVAFKNVPGDISKYNSIVLRVNPEYAQKLELVIRFQADPDNALKYVTKRTEIKFNHTGWGELILPLSWFIDAGGTPDLTKVSRVSLYSLGYELNPFADVNTVLYFDSIYFANVTYETNIAPEKIGGYNYDKIISTFKLMRTADYERSSAGEDAISKLNNVEKSAQQAQASLVRDPDWDGSCDKRAVSPFGGTAVKTSADISAAYNKLLQMASGYQTKDTATYHDKQLLDDMLYVLEYMHVNFYGAETAKSFQGGAWNWWEYEIGTPNKLVQVLMLLHDELTQEQIDRYLVPVNMHDNYPNMTMANRLDVAFCTLGAAILQKDAARAALSRDMLDVMLETVTSGDGFYEDGSFIQHTYVPYTGSYGLEMIDMLGKLIIACDDTCFRFDDKVIETQYKWAVESFAPLIWHCAFFSNVRGRAVAGTSDVSAANSAFSGLLRMTAYVKDPEKLSVLQSILKEYIQYNGADYRRTIGLWELSLYEAIANNPEIKARSDFRFAKIFGHMDRPVMQKDDYAVTLGLSSKRTVKYESINGGNQDGWYMGDGMLYIYLGVNDFDTNYWKNVNRYRLPGTTVTTAPRVKQDLTFEKMNATKLFVGGTALDGSMIAAMDLESKADYPNFKSTLTAQKGWFVFDGEIVCLGSAIKCKDTYNTETIIEDRRLAAGKQLLADGTAVAGNEGVLSGKKTLWFDDFGGVYLPENTDVSFRRMGGDVPFLELYIDHGKNLTDASYAYVMLPKLTPEQTETYASAPDVEILANTASVQAVKDRSTGLTGYIFWKAGTLNGVSVTAPCTLLVSENTVAIADPTMKVKEITVTIDGKAYAFKDLADGATFTLAK